MTVMSLLEASKYSTSAIQKGVMEIYARTSPILQYLPFKEISGNSYTYNAEYFLGDIGFRNVNEEYEPSIGIINPQSESLKIGGGSIKIDRSLINTQNNGNSIISEQIKMRTKAFSLRFTKAVIAGDSTQSPEEFDGLQKRLVGDQVVDAGDTPGGDELSLDLLDQLIDAVEPEPDALIMSKVIRRKVNKLVRAAGQSVETVNGNFGKILQAYGGGIPILVAGYDNENQQILDFNEECPGGGDNVGTSIYAVRWGTDALCGLQNGTIQVEDQGNTGIYRTIIVEWYPTIAIFSPRCCARLRGIKNA